MDSLRFLDEINTLINYALMALITLAMYRLNLTLKIIVDKGENSNEEQLQRSEQKAKCVAIIAVVVYTLSELALTIVDFFIREKNPIDQLMQVVFLFLLVIIYSYTTCVLHSKVNKLAGMQVERREIIKQQLAF